MILKIFIIRRKKKKKIVHERKVATLFYFRACNVKKLDDRELEEKEKLEKRMPRVRNVRAHTHTDLDPQQYKKREMACWQKSLSLHRDDDANETL